MTIAFVLASFLAGVAVERTSARHAIAKRQAKADELRFVLALTIPHSVEDAARRVGC